MAAGFEGVPQIELLKDGLNARLLSELTFFDSHETRWSVPQGAVVDGASIPRSLWSIIGSPFTGVYRDASIIHDWFCDRRTRSWEATHRVFYDAMIVSGVHPLQARAMYFAVRWGGPRWTERVSINARLNAGGRYDFEVAGSVQTEATATREVLNVDPPAAAVPTDEQARIIEAVATHIEKDDLSLEAVEALAEQVRPTSAERHSP